jgi:hypothetical protein
LSSAKRAGFRWMLTMTVSPDIMNAIIVTRTNVRRKG